MRPARWSSQGLIVFFVKLPSNKADVVGSVVNE